MAQHAVRIPRSGRATTEATITAWVAEDGAEVEAGQLIYRLETDKVELDVEAPVAGRVRILGEVGSTYAVGTEVATIESA